MRKKNLFRFVFGALIAVFALTCDMTYIDGVNGGKSGNPDENSVPSLILRGLPFYTTIDHITDVAVYNIAGQVASCKDYKNVAVSRENGYVTARLPLSSASGKGSFTDTGRFAVAFTVVVDIDTQISFARDDNLYLNFIDGSALFDFSSFAHFGARLANYASTARPVIKAGSSFDIKGYRHTVYEDLAISDYTPHESCVLYVYAFRADINEEVYFEYSKTAPEYNPEMKGYYSGSKRALWKMIYLYDVDEFVFKTDIENDFPRFGEHIISNASYSSLVSGKQAYYSLSGSGNPDASAVTLQPGVYAVKLHGAGGGSGSAPGGGGGSIVELLTLNSTVRFTAYTGSGGAPAPAPAVTSGSFSIYGTKNEITGYCSLSNQSTNPDSPSYLHTHFVSSPIFTDIVIGPIVNQPAVSGRGGGGGGSGTFLYYAGSSDKFFLCAGGGGGGSGASQLTPGGAGGAGGVIGAGGNGGASGSFYQYFKNSLQMSAGSSAGGAGGGSGGGNNGSNGAVLPFNEILPGGTETASYPSSVFITDSFISKLTGPLFVESAWGLSSNCNLYEGGSPSCPAITINVMSYSISESSGSGGSVAMVSYPAGPQSWQNTVNAHGQGGPAPALGSNAASGYFQHHLAALNYGVWSSWSSTLSFPFPLSPGINGSDGGNNRNSARGGGGIGGNEDPGGDGSITIYKIY